MASPSDNPRHLWRRYIVAALAIFIVISAEHFASRAGTKDESRFASAINLSGSQRMLNQRILVFGSQVVADRNNSAAVAEFESDVAEFEHAHHMLSGSGSGSGSGSDGRRVGLSGGLRRIYFGAGVEPGLNVLVAAQVSDANIVVNGDAASSERAWRRMIALGEGELVSRLDDAVHGFEDSAHAEVERYLVIETVSYSAAIVLLIVEAMFIFWPAHRSINTTIDRLEAAAHELALAENQAREHLVEAESARKEAERATEAKGYFLANMSHEIRTPMNGVLGMAYALEQTELNDAQRSMLGVINDSGDALMAIINDILDLSKVEAGHLDVEFTEFSLAKLVREVEALYELKAQEKGLKFSVSMPGMAGQAYIGDPTRIRQVLTNLISNALKFTASGEISIDVRCGREHVDGRVELMFSVSDTGLGIKPELATTLFAPFIQADVSTTREYGGTGLGLTICKRLCELMDGWIKVDSEPGKGSTFRFCIPLAPVASAAAGDADAANDIVEGAAADADAGARPLRILAAEDNRSNRLVLEAVLNQIDVDVTFAVNGKEAVEAWTNGAFDLILMDVHMPEMDGLTATRTIRQHEQTMQRTRTPIIALTADAMTHQAERHLAAGMDFHIPKPIKAQVLFEVIAEAAALGAEHKASNTVVRAA